MYLITFYKIKKKKEQSVKINEVKSTTDYKVLGAILFSVYRHKSNYIQIPNEIPLAYSRFDPSHGIKDF